MHNWFVNVEEYADVIWPKRAKDVFGEWIRNSIM
jgi:hypothetical protein